MTDPTAGRHVELPPYLLDVRLNKGQRRQLDLRLITQVRRDESVRRCWVEFLGGPDPLDIHYSEHDRVLRAWRVQQERRAGGNESVWSGMNLNESDRPFIEFDGTNVYSWTPGRDGTGKPEQVHLAFDVKITSVPLTLVQRFKSKGAINALVDALVQHREEVWPTT